MEIAIWTTILTTIVTIIQTWLMWYFSQRVKLEDSEMDELVEKLEDEEEPSSYATDDSVALQIGAVGDWVERELNDHWETIGEANAAHNTLVNKVDGLQQLTDGLLDAIEGLHLSIEEINGRLNRAASRVEALNQYTEPVGPIMSLVVEDDPVEDGPVEQENGFPDRPENTVKNNADMRKGYRAPVERKTPNQLYRDALGDEVVNQMAEDIDEQPNEDLLKPARQEGEPMITDLRAEAFREGGETLDGIYDLPAIGNGYEIMDSSGSGGRRMPRQRGFRRI